MSDLAGLTVWVTAHGCYWCERDGVLLPVDLLFAAWEAEDDG